MLNVLLEQEVKRNSRYLTITIYHILLLSICV